MEYLFYLGLLISIFVHPFQIYISAFISFLLIIINIRESYSDKALFGRLIKPYNVLIIIWFIWGIISILWIKSSGAWVNHILILFTAVGYTITAPTLIMKNKLIDRTKKILLISFIINIIIGLFEVFTGLYLFTQNTENVGWFASLRNPLSFFYNPNDYGVFLVFGIVLTLFYDKKTPQKMSSIIFTMLVMLSSIYLLIMSQARIALFAAIIAIIFKLYFSIKSKKIRVSIILSSIIVLIFVLFRYNDIFGLATEFVNIDYSGNIRMNLIKNSLVYLSDSKFIGVGAGNLNYYLTNYPIYSTMEIFDGHNWWIEILSTYGVFVFIVYIYSYFNLIVRAWKNVNTKNNMKFVFSWLVLFIALSVASSSAFQYIWIWIVNAIFYNEVYKE